MSASDSRNCIFSVVRISLLLSFLFKSAQNENDKFLKAKHHKREMHVTVMLYMSDKRGPLRNVSPSRFRAIARFFRLWKHRLSLESAVLKAPEQNVVQDWRTAGSLHVPRNNLLSAKVKRA